MSTAKIYGKVLEKIWTGLLDVSTDTLKCSLHTSAYSPDQDVDEFFSTISATQVVGSGYTAGGVTLAGITLLYTPSTNTLKIDCDDPAWAAATLTGVRYAVIRKDTGTPASSPLICFMDFLTDQTVTASTFSVVIPTTGFIQDTAA